MFVMLNRYKIFFHDFAHNIFNIAYVKAKVYSIFFFKYTIVGKLKVDKTPKTMEAIEKKYETIKDGKYKPKNCTARQKVAILIPFRDRESHLRIFLNHMHTFLMKQQLEYGIYVVEQVTILSFGKFMLIFILFVAKKKMICFKNQFIISNFQQPTAYM